MTIRTLAEYLPEHPFFADFPDDVIGLLAGCATNVHFSTGEALFLEGEAANALYLIRRGRVAIQVHQPASGATTLATVDEGDVVGWSWLVPPYRWMFDARAMEETSAVSFDATCLRQKAEQDPVARLRAAEPGRADHALPTAGGPDADARHVRGRRPVTELAEGTAPGPSAPPGVGDPLVPRLFRVSRTRQDTRDTFTLELDPVDGAALRFEAGQFTMLHAFGVGEVPISISGDPTVDGPLEHTIRHVGSVTGSLVAAEPGTVLGVRGPFGTGWDVGRGEGCDVVVVAGGIGLAPLRPALEGAGCPPPPLPAAGAALRHPHAGRRALRGGPAPLAGRPRNGGRGHR